MAYQLPLFIVPQDQVQGDKDNQRRRKKSKKWLKRVHPKKQTAV